MNQEKIGKFIAELRKENNMTQIELANKLGVTNRAVSKWENGRGLPDVSLFEPLCKEFNISVNELLKGEKIKETDAEHLSAETMISYDKYIKRREKQKMFLLLIIIAIVLCAFLTTAILSFNKTFFKQNTLLILLTVSPFQFLNILIIEKQAEWMHTPQN